jgi:CheY-like chemotaxis protein
MALEVKLQNVLELVSLDQGRVALNIAPFQLADLLEDAATTAAMAARDKGLQLTWDAGDLAGASVRGDAGRLRQVLGQLLGNAVTFTDEGSILLSAKRHVSGVRFMVEDTGIGIDPSLEAQLFDRFKRSDETLTRARGGIGLGLALARDLVELMGGQIDCRLRPDGGSAFWFDAPLPIEAAAVLQATRDAAAPRILVADDHATNRRLVELVLGDFAEVRSVNDGREAVDAYCAQDFDLILMDIQMPTLDGVSAVAEIRAFEAAHNRRRIPIAMLTANTDAANLAASRAAGADRHIAKPFTAGLLIGSVHEMLCATAA